MNATADEMPRSVPALHDAIEATRGQMDQLVRRAMAERGVPDMPFSFAQFARLPMSDEEQAEIDEWERRRKECEASVAETDEHRALEGRLRDLEREVEVTKAAGALTKRGVPEKDARAVAEMSLDETDAIKACKAAVEARDRIIVLAGPPGVGKTTAAGWLVSKALSPHWHFDPLSSARFMTALELARISVYDDDAMAAVERPDLLVIDDVGAEYADAKGMFSTIIDGVVNARYARSLTTVITTNLNATLFRERYGERVIDRIRECGRFVELKGASMRKRGRAA